MKEGRKVLCKHIANICGNNSALCCAIVSEIQPHRRCFAHTRWLCTKIRVNS